MRKLLLLLMLLFLSACASGPPDPDLTLPCEHKLAADVVIDQHWLSRDDRWRLRQSALLELRGRKQPLEGFMVVDLKQQQLHLVAMNDMGVVFFELLVTATDQQLRRALPQLEQQRGLAEGIAAGLRRIYLQPQPRRDDQARMGTTSLRFWRPVADGDLVFEFDCSGQLRVTRRTGTDENWRVIYDDYPEGAGRQVPEKIVMYEIDHAVTLTVWQREVTLAP